MGVEIDWEAEGLLEGTEGEVRAGRVRLLDQLYADGVGLERLREAVGHDRLAMLPAEVYWERGVRYTADEVAELAGVERGAVDRMWKALGMAVVDDDEPRFTDADVDAARRVADLLAAGLAESGILEVARVIGMSMSQIAAANRALVGETFVRAGDTEYEAGMRLAAATEGLTPIMAPLLQHALTVHLREQMRRDAISREQLERGGRGEGTEVACCFVDMVGYTRLGETLPMGEIGNVTGRFAELVGEFVEPPVRLVKLIGDAAMLISREPQPLLETALELIEAAAEEGGGFPELRAGLAFGEATSRGGDWFGRPVNMASRITGVGRPSSVLASETMRDAVDEDGFSWSNAGSKDLKGIGHTRVLRVRWPEETDEEVDSDGERPGSSRDRRRRRRRRARQSEQPRP